MPYLRLIRYGNLLFIALCLLLIRFGLFQQFSATCALSNFQFILLIFAVIFIAAGGYIINNIMDYEADTINTPKRVVVNNKISEKNCYSLFFIFTIMGVGLGFYIANSIGKPALASIFILTSALLYLYATNLKHIAIVGNLIVSFLVGIVVLLPVAFDLYPEITPNNIENQSSLFKILGYYAWFAFLFNFIREVIKDQEDINGDYRVKSLTLPLLIGQTRTNAFLFIFCLILLFTGIYFIIEYLYVYTKALVYTLLFIIAPLLAILARILKAKSKKDYKKFSLILKLMLFFGLLSLGFPEFLAS
ncbi:geranylgeranylglycerol-phosphate geranylgeranyltransferase [Zunongwangia sp.]|uniref:geranylgeranylglycerol-phosphate geranylgeranyltransferase n=1 Tax=Zunongwangia sp. TaxID=1965325 RepID=UPI003AA7B89A